MIIINHCEELWHSQSINSLSLDAYQISSRGRAEELKRSFRTIDDLCLEQKMTGRSIKIPDFPRNWGPFLGFTTGISVAAFSFASMARTEAGVIVVGIVAATALVVGLIAHLKTVSIT
jgi:hypothetical protein